MSEPAPPLQPTPSPDAGPVHRLAVVALHPIQYQVGLWRTLARHPRFSLRVLYLDDVGLDGSVDPTMNAPMKWDVPLLGGYEHEFVPNLSPLRYTPIVHRINPSLPRRIRAGGFDAIVLHGYLTLSNWLALREARRCGMRVVYRGEGSMRGGDRHDHPLVNRLKRPLNRAFLERCDAIACSSSDNRAYQLSRGAPEDRLFPMPCAVDNDMLEQLAEQAAPAALRQRLGIPPAAPVAIQVGRFTANKRAHDLLEALARPPLAALDVHLVLVGDGPLRADLERLARERGLAGRVHFTGFLGQREVVEAVLASDVFVLCSSHGDPSPKALSEALFLRRPVVCSDGVGTSADLVHDGRNGYVVPTGDVEALAERLARVLGDAGVRRAMGAHSHEIARRDDFRAGVDALARKLDALRDAAGARDARSARA